MRPPLLPQPLCARNTHRHVPVGLLIYAVLADWKKDFDGTLTAVAKMGYQGVELTQYESWTPARAKEVRKLLDSIKLKVFATHTEPEYFVPGDKMQHAIELNQILGHAKRLLRAGPGGRPDRHRVSRQSDRGERRVEGIDGRPAKRGRDAEEA